MLDEKTYKEIYGDDIDKVLEERKRRDNKSFYKSISLTIIVIIIMFLEKFIPIENKDLLSFIHCLIGFLIMLIIYISFNNWCIRDGEKAEMFNKYFKYQEKVINPSITEKLENIFHNQNKEK